MITYTVFDPDDGSGRTYWWYREAMVYVHQEGREVDAFEVAHAGDAGPTFDEVSAAVEARHGSR